MTDGEDVDGEDAGSRPHADHAGDAATVADDAPGWTVDDTAVVGYPDGETPDIGADATIRAGTIVYGDVVAGDGFTTGHHAVVREGSRLGDDVLVGTNAVVDGDVVAGDGVSMQTGVYVPPGSVLGDRVFLGPHAVLTNDPYPLRRDADLVGPTVADGASVGANATLLPGVAVGEDAFVAAGAVVVDDVPPRTLAVGAPATHRPLPPELEGTNQR